MVQHVSIRETIHFDVTVRVHSLVNSVTLLKQRSMFVIHLHVLMEVDVLYGKIKLSAYVQHMLPVVSVKFPEQKRKVVLLNRRV